MAGGNSGSLASNPTTSNIDITNEASSFLWAVFALMVLSAITFLVMGARAPIGRRTFHHLSAVICFTAAISYFLMASDLGSTAIAVEFIRHGYLGRNWVNQGVPFPTRSIWYVRYIDWTVTTPLLLLELLLATGLPLSEIFTIIFFDLVMIVTGLIGALVHSQYKWGLFVFALFAEFYIWYALLVPARSSVRILGDDFGRAYLKSTIVLSSLWLIYPIIWGVSEGGNLISPNAEMIWYGCIDFLAKPVFCFIHLASLKDLDYARLGLNSGKYSAGAENYALNGTTANGTSTGVTGHHQITNDKANPNLAADNGTLGTNGTVNGLHHHHHAGTNGFNDGTSVGAPVTTV